MLRIHEDTRHRTITGATISSVYKKIPKDFGGYLIRIRYKNNDKDMFNQTLDVKIDQRNLYDGLVDLKNKKKERLYFTDGMCDIDMFMSGDKFGMFWSPNDGIYVDVFLSKKEFEKMLNWFKIENN